MADKHLEEDDPMELVGTFAGGGPEAFEEMAITFVEEMARMKWPREEIMTIFADPFYRGPHSVYMAKGPEYVSSLIDSIVAGGQKNGS